MSRWYLKGIAYSDESWHLSLVQKEMKIGQGRKKKVKIKILKLVVMCSEHHQNGWLRLGKTLKVGGKITQEIDSLR